MAIQDLSELDVCSPAEAGAWLELRSPKTGNPIELSPADPDTNTPAVTAAIKLRGANSTTAQQFFRRRTNSQLATAAMGRKRIVLEAEDLLDDQATLLATVTVEWRLPPIDKRAVPFSIEAAKRLYLDPRFIWIKNQVEAFFNDETPFLKNSAGS